MSINVLGSEGYDDPDLAHMWGNVPIIIPNLPNYGSVWILYELILDLTRKDIYTFYLWMKISLE